jgi:hypothetical protein
MPPLITMHSPHPFGNWTLSFGKKMYFQTVHFIAEPTQWKEN